MLLATSEYIAKSAAGESVPCVLSLHAPEPDPLSEHGDYRCKVEITGLLFEKYAHGVDALQALCLGVESLRLAIAKLKSEGWTFYFLAYPDDEFDLLSAYFPVRLAKN
jgi:hypothetical protein